LSQQYFAIVLALSKVFDVEQKFIRNLTLLCIYINEQSCFFRVCKCHIPDNCIDARRYPLFMARDVMRRAIDLIKARQEETAS